MLFILEFITYYACSLFAGAALYVSLVEHPARMQCDTRTAATQWAPSYRRATGLQAPLALVTLVSGFLAWLFGAPFVWFVAALLVGAAIPYTLLVILPTNHRLQEPARDLGSPETRALLERWGQLHSVRTVLSLAALILLTGVLVAQ
jgi:uncharacterized membrane protein